MDKDQFLEFIKTIGTIEDDVERRTKLTELTDNISNIFDTNDKLTQENKQFAEDNEKLRSANMQLFLRVGAEKTEDNAGESGADPEEEKKPREFKDLFNEKGGLK